eukprot:PhF_6_TR5150/c0_g1_i2/m.7359
MSRKRRTIRAVGAGHSFTPLACGADELIVTDSLDRVSVNEDGKTVTVEAGIRLKNLNRALSNLGLAMPQLGMIGEQSIAGAISTGTHGTGLTLSCVGAEAVMSLDMVVANGSIVTFTRDGLLNTTMISLGSMGVIVRVTVNAIPAFTMRRIERVTPISQVIDNYLNNIQEYRNYQFWQVPYSDVAIEVIMTPVSITNKDEETPEWKMETDKYLNHYLYLVVSTLSVWCPPLTSYINRLIPLLSPPVDVISRSDLILNYPNIGFDSVRYTEMEYFIPFENFKPMFLAMLKWYDATKHECVVNAMNPIRVVKGDSLLLSPAHQTTSVSVSFVMVQRNNFDTCARSLEREVMLAYGGRPHLGKRHFLNSTEFTLLFGKQNIKVWNDTRNELDPNGIFLTEYIRTLSKLD